MNKSISMASLLALIVLLPACSRPEPAAPPAPTVMSEEGVIYTANERGNSISVIAVSTGVIVMLSALAEV